jgi:hypothetical protein
MRRTRDFGLNFVFGKQNYDGILCLESKIMMEFWLLHGKYQTRKSFLSPPLPKKCRMCVGWARSSDIIFLDFRSSHVVFSSVQLPPSQPEPLILLAEPKNMITLHCSGCSGRRILSWLPSCNWKNWLKPALNLLLCPGVVFPNQDQVS